MSDFFTQATNLLAQQLAALKGEEIYSETSCMNSEQRQLIGLLRGLQVLAPQTKEKIEKLIPFLTLVGKANWERSELTDLGLRVGQRNFDEVGNAEIEDSVDDDVPSNPKETIQ